MKRIGIIGGGVIGLSLARELALRKFGNITVLEKEDHLGAHASGRNSGVIHSGINQKKGSLKARFCLEGSRLLRDYCRSNAVPMNECGTLVIARNPAEQSVLDQLLEMGIDVGVPQLRIISATELREREPLSTGHAALLSPTGATVDSNRLLEALAKDIQSRGVKLLLGHRVIAIDGKILHTNKQSFEFDLFINCSGLETDRVARMAGLKQDYSIVPFRGEYMEIEGLDIRSMIYQPPDLRFPFLSIHLTRETDGRVLAGPSAVLSFGRESYKKEWNASDMLEMFSSTAFFRMITRKQFLGLAVENARTSLFRSAFIRQIQTIAPSIKPEQVKSARAGIRAQMVDK